MLIKIPGTSMTTNKKLKRICKNRAMMAFSMILAGVIFNMPPKNWSFVNE